MRPALAIAKSTMRAAFRSHLILVLLGLLAVTALILPLIIRGDRTAVGLVQISLSYMLGAIGFILSLVAVWLGCTVTSDEIEGYQVHLVTTKPVARWQWLLGKYLGILVLLAGLLLGSTAAVYGLLHYRLQTGEFPQEEIAKVRNEVLTGRRRYVSPPPDLEPAVEEEFQRRLQTTEMTPGLTPAMVKGEIRRQLKARLTELPPGMLRSWQFKGVPALREDQRLTLRYRMYVNKVSRKKQRQTDGAWYVREPKSDQMIPIRNRVMSGVHHEIYLRPNVIAKDGSVVIAYANGDAAGESVVFQPSDGPFILADATNFAGNYARAVLLIFLQLAFLTILGCAAGANLSPPVAIFSSISYVTIGTLVTVMTASSPEEDVVPGSPALLAAYYVRKLAGFFTVSVNEFNEIPLLTRGQLIEWTSIAAVALNPLLIHGLLVAAVGIFLFSRRDMALVIRRR